MVKSGEPLVHSEESGRISCPHPVLQSMDLKTLLCIPIRLPDRTLGAMVLADRTIRRDAADMKGTLEVIAHHLALEIERISKTADLKVAHDELEQRVTERTAELADAIDRLNTELGERKKTQRTLKVANETAEKRLGQLLAVFESIHEGLIFAEPDGKLLAWNPAAERLLECMSAKPVFITEISERLHFLGLDGKPLSANEWPMQRALKGETFSDCEVMTNLPGNSRILSFSGTSVKNRSGEMTLALTTSGSITRRKGSTGPQGSPRRAGRPGERTDCRAAGLHGQARTEQPGPRGICPCGFP